MSKRKNIESVEAESVSFDATKHLFIEGENREVLKLLYKSYAGRVKMIYIDPSYNTGKDFIYPDNLADPLDTYLRLTGQKDTEGNVLTSNPETPRALVLDKETRFICRDAALTDELAANLALQCRLKTI